MSSRKHYSEPQPESEDPSQPESSDTPGASMGAHSHAAGNSGVFPPAPIPDDYFYRGYPAILLGRAGPPPAPELAAAIDNHRDSKFVGPDTQEGVLPSITALVHGSRWAAIQLSRVGWCNGNWNQSVITVLILIYPGALSKDDAGKIATQSLAILESFGIHDVAVEIAQARAKFCCSVVSEETSPESEPWSPHGPWEVAHNTNPPIGCSIGLREGRESCTLGFFLRIKAIKPNEPSNQDGEIMALTCAHVLAPDRASFTAPVSPTQIGHDAQVIDSPSPRDEHVWQRLVADNIEELTKTLAELSEMETCFLEGEQKKERVRVQRENCMQDLAEWQSYQHNSVTSALGTIYYSSGLPGLNISDAFEPGPGPLPFTTDWALIKLDRERFPADERHNLSNAIPRELTHIHVNLQYPYEGKPKYYPIETLHSMIQGVEDGEAVDAARRNTKTFGGKLARSLKVVKHGRTTGATTGALDAFRAHLRIEYNTPEKTTKPLYTSAFVVSSKDYPFCRKGDSGAQVMAESRRSVGMVIAAGSEVGNPFFSTYIIPTEEVLRQVTEGLQRGYGEQVEIQVELAS